MSLTPLLAIGGPTASGKTDLAIALAEQLGGEIVNADSRQVYRAMDIGTAKPTPAQRAQVPHHLLDLVSPSDPFTLSDYVLAAHLAIRAIHARGALPILAGGTGLYLRAVVQGYDVPAVPPDHALRRRLEEQAAAHGPAIILEQLRAVDPDGAARIDGRNVRRLVRALEVSLTLGRPFSTLQRRNPPYSTTLIILTGDRPTLYARAEQRLEAMLAAGFEAEVGALLDAGYCLDLPSMSALGYREIGLYLHREIDRPTAIASAVASTRSFIRRQLTWFRAEAEAVVLNTNQSCLLDQALALSRPLLSLPPTTADRASPDSSAPTPQRTSNPASRGREAPA